MERKRNNRSDVFIDLTSLLDVIFIILLVVLCGQSSINQNLEETQLTAENAQMQAENAKDLYEDMIDTSDSLNQLVRIVSISVPYDKTEITRREIKVLAEGGDIVSFNLIGNEVTEPLNAFKDTLVEYIRQNNEKPVILSLNEDDEKILYRDEIKINDILTDLSKEYENVYIKENLNEE